VVLDKTLSRRIVTASLRYLGKPFDWETFNCVHFVRSVYQDVDMQFPILKRYDLPPREFHLGNNEFARMPRGHSVFFKRKASPVKRYWTHMAIIIGSDKLIHCTRHLGTGVTITPKSEFLETYALSPCDCI